MHDKEFRNIFSLVLALCVFCGFLATMTLIVQEPGGFSLGFRWVVCAGLTAGFLALFGLDLYGIWTGHLPGQQDDQNEKSPQL